MDYSIKKLFKEPITIYPFDKLVEGDATFLEPRTIIGLAIPKTTRFYDRDGEMVTTATALYMDGIEFEALDDRDEFYTRFTGRVPMQKKLPYPGLKGNIELVEVLI